MDNSEPRLQVAGSQDEMKFDLLQGAVSIDGSTVAFWGGRGVQHLFLGSGRNFDLTCGMGGADRLFLRGSTSDHLVSVKADVLTLRHSSRDTQIHLHASRGPRELVFEDGAIGLGELWRSARQVAALLHVIGEVSASSDATVANHVTARPLMEVGALPQGALLQVEGLGGVETVYETTEATTVNLSGALIEHHVQAHGKVLALSHAFNGLQETAYVTGCGSLSFSDGEVSSRALFRAVQQGEAWPLPTGASCSGLPRITAVALDVACADLGLDDAWPSGLFSGCRVGHVFEASVSLDEAVTVEGSPRLQLSVAGRNRAAHFSGGSGTSTLRFVYTVTEDDVAQSAVGEPKGQTLTGYGNLDVEVGPVLPTGASIRRMPDPLEEVPADFQVSEMTATGQSSEWQSLADHSERSGEEDAAVSSFMHISHDPLDFEVELLIDIDLTALEQVSDRDRSAERSHAGAATVQV
jgi:hypothetical protein